MISNIFSLIILIFSTNVFSVSEETTDDPHTILIPEDLDDESKMQYLGNQDVFDSTLKIIAQTPFKHTFSGSAVFLGRNKHRDIIAITNAHCLAPWVYNDRIIFPLSLVSKGGTYYKVRSVRFHPQSTSSDQIEAILSDIAVLNMEKKILGQIEAAKIDKHVANRFSGEQAARLYGVGYGTSGVLGSNGFVRCDGLKRGVTYPYSYWLHVRLPPNDCIRSEFSQIEQKALEIRAQDHDEEEQDDDDIKNKTKRLYEDQRLCRLIINQTGYGYFEEDFIRRTPDVGESGARAGMSGGGVYAYHKGKASCIAIHVRGGATGETALGLCKVLWFNYVGRYTVALGIPTPFMNPAIGDRHIFLTLAPLMSFIEDSTLKTTPISPVTTKECLLVAIKKTCLYGALSILLPISLDLSFFV